MKREDHPAFQLDNLRGPLLPGVHKEGVPAAHVEAGQGRDGLWYARWSFHIATTGCATPITHSQPYPTERAAIEDQIGKIRAKAQKIAAAQSHNYSASDREWCAKILDWARDQLAPQQTTMNF